MKRVIAFLLLVGVLFGFTFLREDEISVFANCEKIVMVSSVQYDSFENYVENGDCYYYKIEKDKSEEFIKNIKKYDYSGLSFYYDKNINFEYFSKYFNNLTKNASKIDNYCCFYGYYPYFNNYKIIDGKKINVQLVQTDMEWILGFPLILTGY